MDNEFLSLINPKRLILTANRRLVKYLTYQYDLKQSQQKKVWDSLRIMPFSQWLQNLWVFNSGERERILSDLQEQHIWTQIILESQKNAYPLLNVHNTVPLVQEAWRLIHDWEISEEQLGQFPHSAEVESFRQWSERFRQYCQKQSWISQAQLAPRLQKLLETQVMHCQEPLLIAGFHELAPSYSQLLQFIRHNTEVLELSNSLIENQPKTFQTSLFADSESEFRQMALWAKAEMENDPDKRIACIVPQLNEHRTTILDIFKKIVAPHPFNISAGSNLHEFEMIAIALESLAIAANNKIQFEKLGHFLQSVYLCQNESDFFIGAQVEVSCRQLGLFEISLTELYPLLNQWQADYPGHTWLNRWRKFLFIVEKSRGLQQSFRHWTQLFTQLLNALGWPGQRALDSLEYQLMRRWNELLVALSELDAVSHKVEFTTAYQNLKNFSSQIIFQPKTPRTSLEILGILESNGLNFDAIWVAGVDDRHWPTPAQPNPFLPYALQAQQQMPHASQQREYFFAKTITERLLASSREIHFSCSAEESGGIARLSRLIPSSTHIAVPAHAADLNRKYPAAVTEYLIDEYGPAITSQEIIRGGSSIFIRQAECPFRAFATLRLKAEALDEPELGISLRQQGILVHRVLEEIWRQLKNQANLVQLEEAALNEILEKIIDTAIKEEFPRQELLFTQIEKQRLLKLIGEWLQLEKSRPPFEIFALESTTYLEIHHIPVNLKIDRIDKLDNGMLLLIDYKTRPMDIKKWLNARLEQAQIPLYAMDPALQQNLGAVAFAQVLAGNMGFKGLQSETADASNFPLGLLKLHQLKDSAAPQIWRDLWPYWRRSLEKLAADFYHGFAGVEPAEKNKTCRHCRLQALCRIAEEPS